MTEAAFRTVAIGKESSFGTEVDATLVIPVDVGSAEFTLNRATQVPNEDFGGMVQNMSGRGSHGIRIANGQLQLSAASFELLPHLLQMTLGTAVTSGSGTYTHTFTGDFATDTAKSYTFESTDSLTTWIATGVVIPNLELGFDTLAAGDNSMWHATADLQGVDLASGTATAGVSAPSTLQTMEGHLCTAQEGPAGTAYASLGTLTASVVSYNLKIADPKPLRPYGDPSSDKAAARGRGKRVSTVTATVKLASTAKSDIFDIYNVTGALPTDRRWRFKVAGSNDCQLIIDHKLLFTDVHVEPDGRDGERLLSFEATCLYDSTLSSDVKIAVTNLTSSY